MDEYEGRIEWLNYLKVIWKRKWIILIPALLCAATAGIISFLQPPVWEAEAIIRGGRFFDTERNEDILTIEGETLAGQINEGYYNNMIAAELGLRIKDISKIRAKNLQWAELVEVAIKDTDVEKAKNIIGVLFNLIKEDLDKTVISEMESSVAQIIHNTNIVNIESQAVEIRREEILKLQREIAEEKKKLNSADANYADLKMVITEKERQIMTLNNQIERKLRTIETTKSEIALFESAKANIFYTQYIKEPTSSPTPVGPKEGLNMVFAGVLGLFIFGLFAFFLDYIDRVKISRRLD